MLDNDDDAVVVAAAVRAADVAVDVSRTGDIIIHSMECDSQCLCFLLVSDCRPSQLALVASQ